jgi:hypothetical protein
LYRIKRITSRSGCAPDCHFIVGWMRRRSGIGADGDGSGLFVEEGLRPTEAREQALEEIDARPPKVAPPGV